MGAKDNKARKELHKYFRCFDKPCKYNKQCKYAKGTNYQIVLACHAEKFHNGFMAGWNACLEHLSKIPWDKAMTEIVDYAKANCKDKKK